MLVSAVACALAEGLPLRVLRLQKMRLGDDALHPLLRLMQAEARRCLASGGALAGASGFCLEELDLAGNPLSPALHAAAADALQLLLSIRCHAWDGGHATASDGTSVAKAPASAERPPPKLHTDASAQAPSAAPSEAASLQPLPRRRLRRSRSEPCLASRPFELELLIRDAVSDAGEDPSGGAHTDEYEDEPDWVRSHVSFRLRRAEDHRGFRRAAAALASRKPSGRRSLARVAAPVTLLEAREDAAFNGDDG